MELPAPIAEPLMLPPVLQFSYHLHELSKLPFTSSLGGPQESFRGVLVMVNSGMWLGGSMLPRSTIWPESPNLGP